MAQPYIFLSHSSQNRDFTAELASQLEKAGYRCWLDIEDIPDGSTWMREIEKGVMGCGAMIVVMSAQGRESEWVEREWRFALSKRGLAFIDPVPLEDVSEVPPPPELAALHFSDPILAFKRLRQPPRAGQDTPGP